MDKLDIYNNSATILYKKTPSSIISWITILIITLILFIIISFIPFNTYKSYKGLVLIRENLSYVVLKCNSPLSQIYIDNKKYKYEIMESDNDNLVLKINLDESLRINNNIINVNIKNTRTTIFKMMISKIQKGFGL